MPTTNADEILQHLATFKYGTDYADLDLARQRHVDKWYEEAFKECLDRQLGERLGFKHRYEDVDSLLLEALDRLEKHAYLEQEPKGQNALRLNVVPMAYINDERRRITQLLPKEDTKPQQESEKL